MNLKKYLMIGGAALTLGLSSCVGDLDLEPNDPNLVNPNDPDFKANTLAICYSGIACSGISGPGSSYVSGLDAGTSAYLRMIFTLNEFPTDEVVWLWSDSGVPEITACTWASNNGLLEGAYYRLIGHVAICNQFLANTADATDAETSEMRAEARVLRAYSYYNMLDLFGQSSFITEEAAVGEEPEQISRKDLYNWLEAELRDIVDNKLISENPVYGRVGLDGAEALLARLYLNAEVFSGTAAWDKCSERCENIIARHRGSGFQGSGLAEHYLYLFARD
ncbi:MAG: RagB/SusD family nutrient uptake outer membrane protein, partial [Muribaculaceae bacterium]|nr:RagB/SusD family nutrient uptake outer membrane protein [Muribaculaceae bacterium]